MLISDFTKYVYPKVPGCPSALVTQAILDSAKEFFTETRCWHELQDAMPLVNNQSEYDLDQPSGARCIDVRAIYADWMPRGILVPITIGELARAHPSWEVVTSNLPTHYTRELDFTTLRVYPIPTDVQGKTVRIDGVYTLTDTATEIVDDLVERYRQTIAAGAIWRLQTDDGKSWANEKQAKLQFEIYQRGKFSARVAALRGKNSGEIIVPPVRFGR